MDLSVPPGVRGWLLDAGWGSIVEAHPLSGGCIHNGRRIVCSGGRTAFLKTNPRVPPDLFLREAQGLERLASAAGPRVPVLLASGPGFLLLEDLRPARPAGEYWAEFGRRLARLHQSTSQPFGFDHDNYLGSTPQVNSRETDGFTFFAEHRLVFQAELALRSGRIGKHDADRVVRLAAGLRSRIPEQPASLIHGDLWSGNMISDSAGRPAIVDPAAHYGWREAELAMTALFGSPPGEFYAAYQEITPLPPGLPDRFPIYNLYHLLNHVNIFGRGYLGQVRAVLDRFA